MVVPVVHGARRDCGCQDCPDPGDCPEGQECLPSDYVAPCPEGQECLPSDFIDPDDCPGGAGLLESPADLPGSTLLLWLDADDGASFTLDGDDRVEVWADKSGNSFDLAQDGDTPAPIRQTGLAGRSVVTWDGLGGSNRLKADTWVSIPQPATIFLVGEADGPIGDFGSQYPWYDFGGSARLANRPEAPGFRFYLDAGGSPGYPDNTADFTQRKPYSITIVMDDGASDTSMRLNGTEVFDGLFVGGNDLDTPLYVGSDGSNHLIGAGNGFIAEMVVYDGHLSDGDIELVEDYLLRKWLQDSDCDGCAVVADYVPYALTATRPDFIVPSPENVIIGLGPWAYYPMDDASGLIVDASGNGRDATSTGGGGTITYQEPGLTSKRTASIKFEGAYFVLPKPFQLDSGNDWCIIWLEHITTFHGAGSPGQASVLVGETTGGVGSPLVICNTVAGDLYNIWGKDSGVNQASYVQDAAMIGRTCVPALSGIVQTQPRLYLDGVVVGSAQNGGLIGPSNLTIGASDDGFWGYAEHSISDFALFDRALTTAEIQSITEALMDSASFASSVVF